MTRFMKPVCSQYCTNDFSSATAAALVRMVIMIQSNVPSGMCLPSNSQVAID
jgi:hypothetical protein